MDKEFAVCGNCGVDISDVAVALFEGCKSCKSKKIKFIGKSRELEIEPEIDKLKPGDESNIGIKIKGHGAYQLNLNHLMNRNENDPIPIEDKDGVVRMIFNPDDE